MRSVALLETASSTCSTNVTIVPRYKATVRSRVIMLDLLGFRASEKPKLHTYPIHERI